MSDPFRKKGRRVVACPFIACLVAASLGGCAREVAPTVETPGMPNAELALRRSMYHVDREMGELKRMQPVRRGGPAIVPGELDKVVAFEFEGPVEGAVEMLAREVGYDVVVDAPFNVERVSIGVRSGPKRVYDIFQAIGAAAGDRATIQVDAQHHLVQVIYHV